MDYTRVAVRPSPSRAAREQAGLTQLDRLPFSIRLLLESVLRQVDGRRIRSQDVQAVAAWAPGLIDRPEIPFLPARVLMQDFTGVPAVVDLAAMRAALARFGGDPRQINPRLPVDLVIDHSLQVDFFASGEALRRNADLEFQRNQERYRFLRWGQEAFANFRVVPPATGIVHQVNLEYLASVVQHRTTAAGPLAPGATAPDLTLTVTQQLRAHGVVDKFVEFFGAGLDSLSLPDRATIANMAPEYGATVGFFPVDEETLRYLRVTGREGALVDLGERCCKGQRI